MVCKTSCPKANSAPSEAVQKQARNLKAEDAFLLGSLMYDAYKGTIDDEGETREETLVEAEQTLAGKYGPIIWDASFIATENDIGVCATVVTDFIKTGPLLTFVITHPDYQRRGFASGLIGFSLKSLAALNITNVRLYVTNGNTNAINLYCKFGFAIESIVPG